MNREPRIEEVGEADPSSLCNQSEQRTVAVKGPRRAPAIEAQLSFLRPIHDLLVHLARVSAEGQDHAPRTSPARRHNADRLTGHDPAHHCAGRQLLKPRHRSLHIALSAVHVGGTQAFHSRPCAAVRATHKSVPCSDAWQPILLPPATDHRSRSPGPSSPSLGHLRCPRGLPALPAETSWPSSLLLAPATSQLSIEGDYVDQGAILRARPRPYLLRRPLLGYVWSNGTRQYDAVKDHGLPDAFTVRPAPWTSHRLPFSQSLPSLRADLRF